MTNLIAGAVFFTAITNWTGVRIYDGNDTKLELGYVTTNVSANLWYNNNRTCSNVFIETLRSDVAVWRESKLAQPQFITNWVNPQIVIPFSGIMLSNKIY